MTKYLKYNNVGDIKKQEQAFYRYCVGYAYRENDFQT